MDFFAAKMSPLRTIPKKLMKNGWYWKNNKNTICRINLTIDNYILCMVFFSGSTFKEKNTMVRTIIKRDGRVGF